MSDQFEGTHTFERHGGRDQFAEVTARIEPNPGGGIVVRAAPELADSEWLAAIELGLRLRALWPADEGDPYVDLAVTVTGLRDHVVDSRPMSFWIAAGRLVSEAVGVVGCPVPRASP